MTKARTTIATRLPNLALLLGAGWLGACSNQSTGQPAAEQRPVVPTVDGPTPRSLSAINPRLLRRFRPIAQVGSVARASSVEMVALGRALWYDPRLSSDGRISCETCHHLAQYGVDQLSISIGERGQRGRRNAPTVYNTSHQIAQFWDGRASSLEDQAVGPILNPIEMGSTRHGVEATLTAIPEYRALFEKAFPAEREPVTLENVARALGAFERGLTTRSRWDDYLAGNTAALSASELQGLRVFLGVGCMGCHTGPQVGASMLQLTGFVEPWPNRKDLGRFEITGMPSDKMVFKVPTLKNVARTAPYFHDGSVAELPMAVRAMGRHQLGIGLSDGEVEAIVTFLGALTGELPREYIERPALPGAVRVPSSAGG